MPTIGQGGTITLTARFHDGLGALVDPTTPLVDILNPSAVEVVTDDTPTRDGVGLYHYDYSVAPDAPLGSWTIHWSGLINGAPVSGDEVFSVVIAGSIAFEDTPFVPALSPLRHGYLFRGHDATLRFTVPDVGAPQDWSLRWTLRRSPQESALVTKTNVSIQSPTEASVPVLAADTLGLLPGVYSHMLERTDTGAKTVLSYGWAILEDVP